MIGVFRAYSLDQAWQERQFYSRLGMNLIFGYGGPLLQYYPPLASYTTLVWHWLGLDWVAATEATFSNALFLAVLGAYVYARWLFTDRRAALVAGLAYGLAPYLLFCVYERGAMSETVALALLPWVFWSMHHLLRANSRRWIWPSAALMGLLILAHNITALFAVPLLLAYLVLAAWKEQTWRQLPAVGAALGLGLGLSAFYWLPPGCFDFCLAGSGRRQRLAACGGNLLHHTLRRLRWHGSTCAELACIRQRPGQRSCSL